MHKHKTTELSKKKRRRIVWRLSLLFIFFGSLFYGIFFWSNYVDYQITETEIVGQKYTETPYIVNAYESIVAGKYLGLFSKKSFFLLPKKKIIEKMESFLTVRGAVITKQSRSKITIEIVEHVPWGVWCDENSSCYLLNDSGLAFVKKPEILLEELTDFSEEQKSRDILGNYFVEKTIFEKIVETEKLLSRINIATKEVTTKDYQTFIFYTKNGPRAYINFSENKPIEMVDNLNTALEQDSIHEIQFQNLEYVDLRFRGKVYYKIK